MKGGDESGEDDDEGNTGLDDSNNNNRSDTGDEDYSEGESEINDEDKDDNDNDDDDGITGDQRPMNPSSFLTDNDFRQFSAEVQLNNKDAKLRYLLAIPYEITYEDEDLDDENTLNIALRLLYSERVGGGGLRNKPSIYINYDYIKTEVGKQVTREMADISHRITEFYTGRTLGLVLFKTTFTAHPYTDNLQICR